MASSYVFPPRIVAFEVGSIAPASPRPVLFSTSRRTSIESKRRRLVLSVFAGRAPPARCVESTAEREIAKPHAHDWTRRGLVDPEALHFGEGRECGQRNEGGRD